MRTLLLLALLAAAARADPATAELIADGESVAPGGTIQVGVRFLLEKHWHVYWKNPGDSGMPPEIRWKLPEGVTASAIAWPTPKRIPTPPFMTFGYEDEVTLSVWLSLPKQYAAPTLPVEADVAWLVCDANGCVPGEAKLSLEIPVRPAPSFPISSWERPKGGVITTTLTITIPNPFGLPVRPTGTVSARYVGKRILLLAPGAPSFFFPAESGTVEPSADQVREDEGLLLSPAKSREGPVRVLKGVLTFESGPAWEVEVPVEPEGGSGTRLIVGLGVAAAVVLLAAYMLYANRKEKTA